MVNLVKYQPAKAGDTRGAGSVLGLERSSGVGNGISLQYSCLGIPMDRGAWRATVDGITESDTIEVTEHASTYTRKCIITKRD